MNRRARANLRNKKVPAILAKFLIEFEKFLGETIYGGLLNLFVAYGLEEHII